MPAETKEQAKVRFGYADHCICTLCTEWRVANDALEKAPEYKTGCGCRGDVHDQYCPMRFDERPDSGSPGFDSRVKASNPKDAIGSEKVPFSTVPQPVVAEIGLGMLEGAVKYRRHNYRVVGVRSSVYFDAAMRHLTAWWEGQDVDPDSGLSHITKALSTLTVLRDAMLNDKLSDDRPPPVLNQNWITELNAKAKEILAKYAEHKQPYTRNSPELEKK
jgi:hypothetical protein